MFSQASGPLVTSISPSAQRLLLSRSSTAQGRAGDERDQAEMESPLPPHARSHGKSRHHVDEYDPPRKADPETRQNDTLTWMDRTAREFPLEDDWNRCRYEVAGIGHVNNHSVVRDPERALERLEGEQTRLMKHEPIDVANPKVGAFEQ